MSHSSPTRTAKLKRLAGMASPRIRIMSPSDEDSDPEERLLWGDHWVKQELAREFENQGLTVTEEEPADIFLCLYGGVLPPVPENAYSIVWVYSHPDSVTPKTFESFDDIFCASSILTESLVELGYTRAEPLISASSKKPIKRPYEYDIVFVGNARTVRPEGRQIIGDLLPTRHNLKIWGARWETKVDEKYYGGRYWDYRMLQELYASARICLNDHQPDMARAGIVATRIYDVLACGGFVISDQNPGIEGVFGDTVPQYDTPEDLREKVDFFLGNPDKREELRIRGQKIALGHTFRDRAHSFLKHVRNA